MARFRTRHVLKTSAALVALALVTACASPNLETAEDILRRDSASIRAVAGVASEAFCINARTRECVVAKTVKRAVNRGLRAFNDPAQPPKDGVTAGTVGRPTP